MSDGTAYNALVEDSVQRGLDFIRANPGLKYTFSSTSAGGTPEICAVMDPCNEAAKQLENVLDPHDAHSGASYSTSLREVMEVAVRDLGCKYNSRRRWFKPSETVFSLSAPSL